jgi:hypothetical protein
VAAAAVSRTTLFVTETPGVYPANTLPAVGIPWKRGSNLQGNTLDVVAFTVLSVDSYYGGSELPNVRIRIDSTANCPTSTTSLNGQAILVR